MPNERSGSKQNRAVQLFAAEDPYRNIVRLERETWEKHIILRHDELAGCDIQEIKKIISAPDTIRESLIDPDSAAFEVGRLRVIVAYDTPDFAKGNDRGRITTIYPINRSLRSNVGKVLFEGKT